jgi:hypothetical protein
MTAIHRREMLGVMLGGAVVAAAGLALMPVPAESAPLTMSKSLPATTENFVEEAVSLCAAAAGYTAAAGCAGGTGDVAFVAGARSERSAGGRR